MRIVGRIGTEKYLVAGPRTVRYSYNADRKLLPHPRITQIAELFKGERNIRIIKINKTQDNSRNSQ